MFFFDANCSIGMRSIITKNSFYNVDILLKEMEKCNIKNAMVYSTLAEEYHPIVGNERLIRDIKKYKSLNPVWVILPHHTREFYDPSELIGKMKINNVKMVRVFPNKDSHNYCLSDWSCGELLNMLDKNKIPLIIGMDQVGYDIIFNIAKKYSKIPLILSNVGYRADRFLYPLLDKYDNIYIETSSYKVNFGIETICQFFGAKRLIFGTGLPVYCAGSAITMITHAMIKNKEKIQIARENIEHILKEVEYE